MSPAEHLRGRWMAAGLLLGSLAAAPDAGAATTLRLAPCGAGTCVCAELPADLAAALAEAGVAEPGWRRAFAVRTAAAADAHPPGPSLFGDYALAGATLVFEPRLPLLPHAEYVATLDPAILRGLTGGAAADPAPGPGGPPAELRFRLPPAERDPPRVTAIHPAGGQVPANLLRAYVHFSTSMRPDVAADHLHLEDAAGGRVEMPFVEVDGGLWDPRHTRLTLLFHPGRLKRGVAPRDHLGPPLEEGATYRLVVSPGWPSATGEPLAEGAARSWSVGPPDRGAVTPERWRLHSPPAGTDEPLRLDLDEPLDRALALRLLRVTRGGEPVTGRAELSDDGTRWSFRPTVPWTAADHTVRILPALEDLAGNSPRGAFDRAPGEPEAAAVPLELPFRPGG